MRDEKQRHGGIKKDNCDCHPPSQCGGVEGHGRGEDHIKAQGNISAENNAVNGIMFGKYKRKPRIRLILVIFLIYF